MAAVVRIGAVIAFAALLGVQVSAAQQQTTPADPHHLNNNNNNNNSNQSGSSMTEQQQQQNRTILSGQVMMNQTFTTSWISLVNGVKVTGISVIDNEHVAINLSYDGEGGPPGVSVVAVVAITNSSSGTIIGSMMQNSTSAANSSMSILSIQSGSNYLEAGWQGQESNSATILVQLDGEIPEGGHIMVMVFPFLHR